MKIRKARRMGKKGSIVDVMLVLIVFAFVIGLSSLIAFKFYNAFYDVAAPQLNSSNYSIAALDSMHNTETNFDYIFMAVIVGLIIDGYILAFMTRENPVFIFIDFIIVIIMVVLGVIMSNAYEVVSQDPQLLDTALKFPIQQYFFSNLPLIMAASIAGMIVVMFAVGGERGY